MALIMAVEHSQWNRAAHIPGGDRPQQLTSPSAGHGLMATATATTTHGRYAINHMHDVMHQSTLHARIIVGIAHPLPWAPPAHLSGWGQNSLCGLSLRQEGRTRVEALVQGAVAGSLAGMSFDY